MKILKDILYKTGLEEVIGTTNVAIENVFFDSRAVESFSLFVAVSGTQVDGHKFIDKAVEKGAVAVVCEQLPEVLNKDITYVKVGNSAEALGYIACNFYDNPSEELKLVGVTGTNGKTSVVTLLHQLFQSLGYKCGMLSTVVNKIGDDVLNATHTTPDALSVNRLMHEMVEEGCDYCFMEASSHAIDQHRVTGLDFDVAVFTNITHDHLDYHKTFKNYINAKKLLFDNLKPEAFALVNNDDRNGAVMVQNTSAKVQTYGVKTMTDFKAKVIENQFTGLQLSIDGNDVWTRLVGGFNAYNLLAVYGVALLLEQDKMDVLTAVSKLDTVNGRFEYIKTPSDIAGIVDYAHTPDALENVLETIKEIRTRNEQVITVVGCGGDRDKAKRPEMARIACKFSDKVIFTSDNPRSEEPDVIIADMQAGVPPQDFKKTLSITNRKEAIKAAVTMAESGDIILVAGKGHETYQEIKGVRHDFDDMAVLTELFQMIKG
ncbi:MAG: UDP-N-acetylmuramoyl-L-alanyl-D-glutamate--2,6-diaminopimelate ligase [Crocinitomicaceae bacterium]|nr:UDP-N-acetylmuramoyl-L-alanyl-D-glutamate--2,6-diaminopimelate ligase [Crocinitomicaceae bacterium]